MTTLVGYRAAVVEKLTEQLGRTVRAVRAHSGSFDEGELARFFDRTPTVLVVPLGVQSVRNTGELLEAELRMALFVLTSGVRADERDEQSLGLIDALLRIIAQERWLPFGVRRAANITADNRYSASLDKAGHSALWIITWSQLVELPALDAATLDDFLLAHVSYELAEPAPPTATDAAEDNIRLEQTP